MTLKKLIVGAGIVLSALVGCEPGIKENVDVCKGVLQPKYELYLENNQKVASSLIWNGSTKLQYAEDCNALENLAELINGRIEIIEPPVPAKYEEDRDRALYDEKDAWEMYLAHIANSLTLEVENALPWKLSSLDRKTLRLMLDGREFIVKKGNRYTFDDYGANARIGVTDWSPRPVFDFMAENNLIGETQEDTLYKITDWMRESLVHATNKTPEDWDNYSGSPPVDQILNPKDGIHWTEGCWGTTSLFMAMLQSVNIPVRRGRSYFATTENKNFSTHSRPEFPTLGKALIHGDNPYNLEVKGHYHNVPVQKLFLTMQQLEQMIDSPDLNLENGYHPGKAEATGFNKDRFLLALAAEYKTDFLLYQRAFELLGGKNLYGTLDEMLAGISYNSQGEPVESYWKPFFDAQEREEIIKTIDEELVKLGNGSLEEGCQEALRLTF